MPNVTIEKRMLVPFLSTPILSDLVLSVNAVPLRIRHYQYTKTTEGLSTIFQQKYWFFHRADNICIDNMFSDSLPFCPVESSLLIWFLVCFLVDADRAKLECDSTAIKNDLPAAVVSMRIDTGRKTRRKSQSSSSPNSQSAETQNSLHKRTTTPRSGKLLLRSHKETVSCDTENLSPILLWVQPRSMRSDFNFSPKFSIS